MTCTMISHEHIIRLEQLALEVTGVPLSARYREQTREAFEQLTLQEGQPDPDRLLETLAGADGVPILQGLVGRLTTKETYLFRDPDQFDILQQVVVPRRASVAAKQGRKLRIWCAGCATGEEPYSVAMLLAESPDVEAVILGTDISPDAISMAMRGLATGMRLAPDATRYAALVKRWTDCGPDGSRFAGEVRSIVHFATHNVVRDTPPSGQDIVMCRNVMIYLSDEERIRLLRSVWRALLPGGLLLLGEAELLHMMKHRFERLPTTKAIVYTKPTTEPVSDHE